MYSFALFCLCSPSSLDAIFLAHALVVLQALPVSYIIISYTMILMFKMPMDTLMTIGYLGYGG